MVFRCYYFAVWPYWFALAAFHYGQWYAFSLYPSAKRFDLVINILFSYFIIFCSFCSICKREGFKPPLGLFLLGLIVPWDRFWREIEMDCWHVYTLLFNNHSCLAFYNPFLLTPDYITPEINTIIFRDHGGLGECCILFFW